MQIKPAASDMLDDILALETMVWREESATRESLAKRIELLPDAFPVVFIGKQLAGFANSARLPMDFNPTKLESFTPWEKVHDPNGELLYLYCATVHPDFRKHGIWKELLNFRLEYARRTKEIRKAWVCGRKEADQFGPATGKLLERLEFKVVKELLDDTLLLELLPPYKLKI